MTHPRIVFVGAGSVEFTQGLLADLFAFPELRSAHIALHDIDPERLATAEAAARHIARVRGADARITAHADRRTALTGADFVINIVQIGMGEATRTDFDIPARYGLRQTIGDTLGVGGIFRALRTFPFLKELGEDIARLCPDAWLLNYTNPMAMNIQYLTEATGLTRVVGLCHSVYWTMQDLAKLVDVPYAEITYRAAGVNHQAWVLRFEHQGRDLYPRLDELIAGDEQLRRRVRVDMYRRLGYYPTETSEHSSEYVPWYLRHDSEIDRLRLPIGAYLDVVDENVATYHRTRDAVAAGAPLTVEGTMEYAPQIIHSVVTGTPRTVYGNTGTVAPTAYTRPMANDPFRAGGPSPNDVSAALFLLLRTQDITSEVFTCPSSNAEKDTYGGGTNAAINKSNFSDLAKNLSYSYQHPYPDANAIGSPSFKSGFGESTTSSVARRPRCTMSEPSSRLDGGGTSPCVSTTSCCCRCPARGRSPPAWSAGSWPTDGARC